MRQKQSQRMRRSRSPNAAGDHRVQITGIAPHCSLGGANPQTVNVASAGLAHVTFQIACTTPTGGIEVTTTTAGESLDPDGFSIQLDGQASQPIGTSETKTFAGVTAGTHTLELTGASRTAVLAATTRARWWFDTGVVQATFDVSCQRAIGSVTVHATTAGIFPDPNGYTVSLDGGPEQPIGSNDSVTVPGLLVGDHIVQLARVATNCTIVGNNPQTATVMNGGTREVLFQVTCRGTGSSVLLFASDRSGTSHIYSVRDDGSGFGI